MTRCRILIAFNVLLILTFVVMCLVGAHLRSQRLQNLWPAQRELARSLQLTDLAVWTESRYTRHPSQADRFAPFQDLPSSLEHFPAGSVVPAPPALRDLASARH